MRGHVFRITMVAALSLGSAAPIVLAQEREWNFNTGDEEAYLVFGVPESDDVGVSFWCTIGRGDIGIFLPAWVPSWQPARQ
jgi:hypothetical protein